MKPPRAFDLLGNVAVLKFPREFKQSEKKKIAKELMQNNKSVTTVLEKVGKVSGRLRTPTTKWLAGEKTKEVLCRENNCVFRFNIDKTYFSPRLSNERKELAGKIKKGENVFVMFAGVAVFPIVIAKNSRAGKIYSNEISREANKYAKLNIELNKVKDRVELLPGDVKRVVEKIEDFGVGTRLMASKSRSADFSATKFVNTITKSKAKRLGRASRGATNNERERDKFVYSEIPKKFEVIIMPRPQLKDSFLEQAFRISKRGTRVFYYDFCDADKTDEVVERIKDEARRAKKRIKILKTKRAGEIAPYKIRVRVDFLVL